MATSTYSGSIASSTSLNSSPSASLSGGGGITGVLNNVFARLNFSTNAYSDTYSVTATLYFSGGSAQSTRSVKMDSSNYTNAQFDFYFTGLTVDQANSITSVQAYCSTNGNKIFMKGSQYAYVDYTVPSAVGAPTSFYPSSTITTNDYVTLYWSGATHGTAYSISSDLIEYCDSTNGVSYGSWQTLKTVSSSATSGSTSAALPSARNYRKFRIRTQGTQGSDYYSDYVESSEVLRTSTPSAPSNVTVTPSTWESGNVVFTWDASTATGQTISRYYLQYRLKKYGSAYGAWTNLANTDALTYSYTPPLEKGDQIQYQIRALSSDGVYSSYSSAVTVIMETEKATNLRPSAGWYATLSTCQWTPPDGISYCKYAVSTDGGTTWGAYTSLASGVNSFDASSAFGSMAASNAFQYRVVGVAANGDLTDAAYSALLYKNTAPLAPVFVEPALTPCTSYGKMYSIIYLPADPNIHTIKLQYKQDSGEWQDACALTDVSEGLLIALVLQTTAIYSFRIVDVHEAPSTEISLNVTISALSYTDNPITAGTTRIKAAHINELRFYTEALCTLYGVTVPTWDETITAGTTSVKDIPDHITEIRTALTAVYNKINQLYGAILIAAPTWAVTLADCQPKAAAIEEARQAIRNV